MAKKRKSDAADPVSSLLAAMPAAERSILVGAVYQMLCEGMRSDEMAAALRDKFPEALRTTFPDYAEAFNRQRILDLVRFAAVERLLRFDAPLSDRLAQRVRDQIPWPLKHPQGEVTVLHTAVLEHLAQTAAGRLLDLVQLLCTMKKCETVHIGFAGGRSLRSVAASFATLLDTAEGALPKTIVFHAMVAGFNQDDDYVADPNSFVTYFVPEHRQNPRPRVGIRFVALPMPGLVENSAVPALRRIRAVDAVYKAAEQIQIIVTSGGSRADKDSTLRTLMPAAGVSDEQLDEAQVEGDLLWQPLSRPGAAALRMESEISTLMRLQDLPDFIRQGDRFVLLVLACCGRCSRPKGDLLDLILQQRAPLFTHLVADSPTVADLLHRRNQPL